MLIDVYIHEYNCNSTCAYMRIPVHGHWESTGTMSGIFAANICRPALVDVARIACPQRIMRSQPAHLPASALFRGEGFIRRRVYSGHGGVFKHKDAYNSVRRVYIVCSVSSYSNVSCQCSVYRSDTLTQNCARLLS